MQHTSITLQIHLPLADISPTGIEAQSEFFLSKYTIAQSPQIKDLIFLSD